MCDFVRDNDTDDSVESDAGYRGVVSPDVDRDVGNASLPLLAS